jgi:hypothetical protein
MPDSSFFTPITSQAGAQMGGVSPFGVGPSTQIGYPGAQPIDRPLRPMPAYRTDQNLKIKGGYVNQYGTDIQANYTPGSNAVGGSIKIPVGDHQSGYRAALEGFYHPGGVPGSNDYGVMLSFGKSNTPKVSSEEALASVNDPAMRQFFQNNPDALEKLRRHQVDSQLGIGKPGTQEYGFNLGVDTNTTRSQTPQSLIQQRVYNEQLMPAYNNAVTQSQNEAAKEEFAKQKANDLLQNYVNNMSVNALP